MRLCSVQRDRCQSMFWLRPAASRHRGSSMIAWRFVPTRRLIYPGDDSRVVRPSGVARNFRQGVRQSVAFLSVHPRSAALPSRPYTIKKRHDISYRLNDWTNNDKQLGFTLRSITLRNHIPKNYVFSWQGVRTPLTPLVWLRRCSNRAKGSRLRLIHTGNARIPCLNDLVRVADLPGRRRLRWSSSHQLLVPPFRLTTVGRRTFPVAAASLLCNSLPSDIQSSPSLPVFRQRLKTVLLRQSSSMTPLRLRGLRNSSAIL